MIPLNDNSPLRRDSTNRLNLSHSKIPLLERDLKELFINNSKSLIGKHNKVKAIFEANGYLYQINKPDVSLPIARHTAFLAMDSMFTFGMTVNRIAKHLTEHEKLMDKAFLGIPKSADNPKDTYSIVTGKH